MTDLPRDIEHELAALADGSLAPERRAEVNERVRGSPELQNALAEQQSTVALLTAVNVRAPASLHGRVEQMLAPAARRKRVLWRPRLVLAATAAAAIAVVAVAIGLSGGGSGGGSSGRGSSSFGVRQAAALTLSPATMPAPAESSANRANLAATVGGVPFPYWKERFGWRGSGARTDRVGGRAVTTVFYSNAQGRRIGYAIASGHAPSVSGGTAVRRWGVDYRVLSQSGATVVAWERDGHLCVVAGRGVSARTLLGLASWGSARAA
jgi:anti-sigma factor RsiW